MLLVFVRDGRRNFEKHHDFADILTNHSRGIIDDRGIAALCASSCAHISAPVFRILSLYFSSLRLPSSSMSSVGMLLGSLAALAHPGLPPQGASAPAVSGVRGGDAAGALGQNPLARYDFGNSSFDLSALSMPSSWWRVKVRRARARGRGGGGGTRSPSPPARAPISSLPRAGQVQQRPLLAKLHLLL
jgi:hypothetical protein